MGDTRIDGSTRNNAYSSECDEESGVCGAVKKTEPEVSKADPLVSNIDENFHVGVMLPEDKPSYRAQIAKNMATPKPPAPPTDAELKASYEKMSDADLEKEVKTLGNRLSDNSQYSGADLDTRKFHAAEAVAKSRADAARPPEKQAEEGWHVPVAEDGLGISGQAAVKTDGNVKYGEVSGQLGLGHTGAQGAIRHEHDEWHFGHGVDFVADDNVGTAGVDVGIHNNDGSWGVHAGGGAAVGSWEGTVSKRGVGSFTFGASAGASEQVSVGVKKDGKTFEVCGKVDAGVVTVGVCLPFVRM
jgi:hypothetical protein